MSGDVILGAGIAGLAAAYCAQKLGFAPIVYESAERPGGLLDGFTVDGWQFDNGAHLSFATEPEVRAIFDQTPYIEHTAAPLNWDQKYWLRHPVHNNMYPLPDAEKAELIADFLARPHVDVCNYKDWLLSQYGAKIAERWALAYTKKYWTIPAEAMGVDWVGSRMRQSDIQEMQLGAAVPDAPNTYYLNQLRYPVRGGYGAFLDPLIKDANIKTRYRAVALNWQNHSIEFANGEKSSYDRLISTIPLPELVNIMTDVPMEIRELSKTLFATHVDLISVGLSKATVAPNLWFYVYDEDIWASRIYSPTIKSPNSAPEGCSSLQFEIYSSSHRPLTAGPDELKENCLYALEKMGLASRQDVLFTHHKHIAYANVVFDLGMEARRDKVKEWVASKKIELAGRFGEWGYLWSNQSFMSGMRAAEAWRQSPV